MSRSVLAFCLLATVALPQPARAAVNVIVGSTAIVDGEATAARDITVSNEHLAFALAVESPAPYGVPRGAIVDVAPVVDGKPGRDRVVFADFIPNNWSAWPSTYQKVDILERGPDRVVVRAARDWDKVAIETTYALRAGSDRVEIRTTMTNTGATRLPDLLSGQTLWPSAGYFFAVPGLGDLKEGVATGALADRVVAYDEDWIITLHAPYLDYVGSGSADLLKRHTLEPGASQTFDAWLQVGTRGDLGPTLAAEIERKRLEAGTVRGGVTTRDGKPVDEPVVVILKHGAPYAWVTGRAGRYATPLPIGDYELYATAKGYSQSEPVAVTVAADATTTRDLSALDPPGRIDFDVRDARGRPLDARIAITQGQKPLVEYLGRHTFFTELDRKGRVETALAPGAYRFAVSSGGGFLAPIATVQLDVRPGESATARVAIERLFDSAASGWYSADLHHHADQAEGVTPPEYVARSQLAAGLDLLLVSDHDSIVNHAPMQAIAERRGVPFLPSLELSPSWAHFNAWPLRLGETLGIDTSTATVDEVFAEARRLGAIVVQSNHPFIPYGYFASLAARVAPGGFNPRFELLEINAERPDDDHKVLSALWGLWNAGHRYYLSGGTDVHDVWNFESGRIRTYAHVAGALTPQTYAEAVKTGHAYVSYGPLIVPDVMFGSELKVAPGATFTLSFSLSSVAGLKRAVLIGAGTVVATKEFADAPRESRVEFPRTVDGTRWYSLQVEDAAAHEAYTNPIWIDAVDLSGVLPARGSP
jgi:hypothetical protein